MSNYVHGLYEHTAIDEKQLYFDWHIPNWARYVLAGVVFIAVGTTCEHNGLRGRQPNAPATARSPDSMGLQKIIENK